MENLINISPLMYIYDPFYPVCLPNPVVTTSQSIVQVHKSYLPGINPTCSWCIILLKHFYSIGKYFAEEFCIYVPERFQSVVFFSFNIFVLFLYKGNAGLTEWVKKYFLYFYHLKETVESWYNFFLKCFVKFASGPGVSCFGMLLIINSDSLIYIVLFRWVISSYVSFDR